MFVPMCHTLPVQCYTDPCGLCREVQASGAPVLAIPPSMEPPLGTQEADGFSNSHCSAEYRPHDHFLVCGQVCGTNTRCPGLWSTPGQLRSHLSLPDSTEDAV
jgi:hypothetical protein